MATKESLEWAQKLYRIMKDGEPVALRAGPGSASTEVERLLPDDYAGRQNIPQKIASLKENESCDLGGGVTCKRIMGIEAPVIDPEAKARRG